MKNLENYGVQVLDAKEIREVDGGGFWDDLTEGTSYSGTSNPIVFLGETAYNAGVMIGNAWDMIFD
ncbi:hypothetical protein [Lutibacter sp.]